MTTKKLNASEKLQITKHTVLGYSIVKDLNFSLPIQLGVLEHHEKSNGSGYPRHLTGDQISAIGRIIAVACTYEAISSSRSYKDDRSSFDALLELIQNKENQYDGNVLKALLYTVSLYPIGTYVYLTNRKIAEVIDSNPTNPKCPIVQLITEKEPDGSPKIIQTNPAEIFNKLIRVVPLITPDEQNTKSKIILLFTGGNVGGDNYDNENLSLDIYVYCPFEEWRIAGNTLRPFAIMSEIRKSLQGKRINGLGEIQYNGFTSALMTNQMGSYEMSFTINAFS